MAKQQLSKGFTLLELLMVFSIISLLSFLIIPSSSYLLSKETVHYLIKQTILTQQIKAIAQRTKTNIAFESIETPFHFNAKGNINRAGVFVFDYYHHAIEIVFWLGVGRFEIR